MLHGSESASPTVDAFVDADKEEDAVDTCPRSESVGPLGLSDLEPNEDENANGEQEDIDSGRGGDDDEFYVFVDEDNNDDEEEEEENEDELKEQFYRQQQMEQQQQEQDVDQFLEDGLCFLMPEDIRQPQQSDETRHVGSERESGARKMETQAQQKVEVGDANEPATRDRKSSHPETAGASTQEEPRRMTHGRRPSNALLPDGILHLWIFQARQVAFRQHFESMYARHGLHLRCYLAWKREYLSDIYESNRNVGGNMNNPLWRFKDDHTRDFMRGHFSIPLGCHSSPASLPANTELIIEIVCGILVVASTRVSLLEFFQDCSSRSSAEDDSGGGLNETTSQWLPLLGENAGLLEVLLEFVPADSFEDDDSENGEIPFDCDANASYDDTDNNSNLDETIRLEDTELEVQDPSEPNALEREYRELEQRALALKTRLENPELREKYTDISRNAKSDDDSAGYSVVVSNNGKTTMYIPKQCRPQHEQQPSNEIQMQAGDNEAKMIVPHRTGSGTKQPESTPSQEVMIDEQVLDLYRFGISCEDADQHGMSQTSSSISHVSEFSCDYSEYTSMYSHKASTCATDIFHYNELIQELEASLLAAAARENAQGYRSFMPLSNTRKADGMLRHAAPTSIPHPMTAAMGMIPTKSSMKKNGSFGVFGGSYYNNNDPFASEKSSIQEAPSKGVVLFDLNSIPERHRNGLERNTSEEGSAMKSDRHKGRRRSLPVNSLTPKAAQPRKVSSSRGQSRVLAIEESKDKPDPSFDAMLRHKRRSSLHSLTDLESRGREFPRNNSNRQLKQSQQHQLNRGSSGTSSSQHSNQTSARSQKRTSTSNSVINLGGAVLGVGKFINVGSVPGVVRYVGPTNFATGTWIGIELCEKKGKNNGTVKGTQYFTCAPDYGVFIRANRLEVTHQ